LSLDLEASLTSGLELDSVFKRRRTPETAYEIGYVKYEEEGAGVDREGGEEVGVESVFADIERCLQLWSWVY
jgi:hypothetical protein